MILIICIFSNHCDISNVRGFKEKGLRHIVNQPHSAAIDHAQCTVCTPPRAAVFHASILWNIDRFTQTSLRALSLLTVVQNFVRDCSRVTIFNIWRLEVPKSTFVHAQGRWQSLDRYLLVVWSWVKLSTHPDAPSESERVRWRSFSCLCRKSEKYHQNEPTMPRVKPT